MRLIICDNPNITITTNQDTKVIFADTAKPCIGCFKCWCSKPNRCALNDNKGIKDLIEKADKIVLVSQNTYGSISAPIKRLIDRSLSSVQPFFTFRNGLMRHKLKPNHIHKQLTVYFYGNTTQAEKQTARNMLQSLCENLGATLQQIKFHTKLKAVTL